MMHIYGYGYNSWLGMHWAWFVAWLLLVGTLIWAMVRLHERSTVRNPEPTPLDILRRRYAAGEISTQEFNERLATLQQSVMSHR